MLSTCIFQVKIYFLLNVGKYFLQAKNIPHPLKVKWSLHMNDGHLLGPFVIDKKWLLFKRANKIHVLLFITNIYVLIIANYTPTPASQVACLDPLETSEAHCTPDTVFNAFNPKHFCKLVKQMGDLLYFFWQNFNFS